jgi:Cof subfamily protein (haloacid dehalogenase superfamily)
VSIPGYRPKLIATDLDGTVVPHDEPVSQRTIDAFRKAHSMGIEIFYVTGRPPRWMENVKNDFGVGNAICANGAILFDLMNQEIIEQWLLSVETQREIAMKLREAIPGCYFAIEHGEDFHREKNYNTKWDAGIDNVGVDVIEDRIDQPAFKMMVRHPEYTYSSDEMLERAIKAVGDICNPTHSNPHESHLEISAFGVSKGQTLAKIAERAGIAQEDVVSFGDNPNDFSMLEWAGRSWAMADGHPDCQKYANFVADPHKHDGVAIIIEKLLELPARPFVG